LNGKPKTLLRFPPIPSDAPELRQHESIKLDLKPLALKGDFSMPCDVKAGALRIRLPSHAAVDGLGRASGQGSRGDAAGT
jgi:hypothetical protein